MGNVFRIINYDGDIEISIYKKANAVFKSSEYNETEDVCIQKETINIFNLLKENQELKNQLEEHKNIYIKKVNNFLAENVEPDPEDLYMAELEQRAMDCELMEMQQKEFIKYLEDYINSLKKEYGNYVNDNYSEEYGRYYTAKEILQKYKEIIGDVKNENNNV